MNKIKKYINILISGLLALLLIKNYNNNYIIKNLFYPKDNNNIISENDFIFLLNTLKTIQNQIIKKKQNIYKEKLFQQINYANNQINWQYFFIQNQTMINYWIQSRNEIVKNFNITQKYELTYNLYLDLFLNENFKLKLWQILRIRSEIYMQIYNTFTIEKLWNMWQYKNIIDYPMHNILFLYDEIIIKFKGCFTPSEIIFNEKYFSNKITFKEFEKIILIDIYNYAINLKQESLILFIKTEFALSEGSEGNEV